MLCPSCPRISDRWATLILPVAWSALASLLTVGGCDRSPARAPQGSTQTPGGLADPNAGVDPEDFVPRDNEQPGWLRQRVLEIVERFDAIDREQRSFHDRVEEYRGRADLCLKQEPAVLVVELRETKAHDPFERRPAGIAHPACLGRSVDPSLMPMSKEMITAIALALWDSEAIAVEWQALNELDAAPDTASARKRLTDAGAECDRLAKMLAEIPPPVGIRRPRVRTPDTALLAARIREETASLGTLPEPIMSQQRLRRDRLERVCAAIRLRVEYVEPVDRQLAPRVEWLLDKNFGKPVNRFGIVSPTGTVPLREELARERGLCERHRYAMVDRWGVIDAPRVSMYTWPVSEQLWRAAVDFSFWYAWATDEGWYRGSDRRLRPEEWPRDDERTKALHAEFADVVLWRHWVFNVARGAGTDRLRPDLYPRPLEDHDRWAEYLAADAMNGVGDAYQRHLAMYFAPLPRDRAAGDAPDHRLPSLLGPHPPLGAPSPAK